MNFFSLKSAVLSVCAAALVSSCATTPVTQKPAPSTPVATGPAAPEPQTPKPKKPEPKKPKPKTPKPEEPKVFTRNGLTPPHMAGRDLKRVALLLPFSAKNPRLRAEADSMLKAAELAVFDREDADVLLIALDTAGTTSGARAATQSALSSGVDVVLGPLLSGNAKASGAAARRSKTPVISFSTDQSAAGNGVYLLSFPPEAEVDRITDYAAGEGVTRFAILGPDSAYGRRVNAAYQRATKAVGGEVTAAQSYQGNDITVMQAPARAITQAYMEQKTDPEALPLFEAILLPEGGTALRSLAPLLTYYSSDIANVVKLGTGLWNREGTELEPALRGGIFAGPDEAPRKAFKADYQATYGSDPSALASLAYDAVNIGVVVADGDPRKRISRVIDPAGFYGVDGFVRFRADGTPERGLAVYQVGPGRFDLIDPAPRQADELGVGTR